MSPDPVGTSREVPVESVVDGDTVKVHFPEATDDADGVVSLRILALDTEETRRGGSKPKTPLGDAAKERARELVPSGSRITVEFPGEEPFADCLKRYRDNFGRLLCYVHTEDGEDYQETLIEEGFSPYFTKYGYANADGHHRRYRTAERRAQARDEGVWDQLANNGAVMRDYDTMCAWWELRAEVVDTYRRRVAEGASVLDSRLDYELLASDSTMGEEVTVFTELDTARRVGAAHAVVDIGSHHQPFKLFLPRAFEMVEGQEVLSLLEKRYIAVDDGRTVTRPNRSYGFVTGELKRFPEEGGSPEIVVRSIDQLTDDVPDPSE